MINLVDILKHLSILAFILEAIHRIIVFAVNILQEMIDKQDSGESMHLKAT